MFVGFSFQRFGSTLATILALSFFFQYFAAASQLITYGSIITLRHKLTSTQLFSAKFQWGTGDGYQIVTAAKHNTNDDNYHWVVKTFHNMTTRSPNPVLSESSSYNVPQSALTSGNPVKCSARIRLEHLPTLKNLHAQSKSAVLTKKHAEVSAYGDSGVGNEGDDFIVECASKSAEHWEVNSTVRLRHAALNNYLATNPKSLFTSVNCPRCPIIGHQEVMILRQPGSSTSNDVLWGAESILSIENFGEQEDASSSEAHHDEL